VFQTVECSKQLSGIPLKVIPLLAKPSAEQFGTNSETLFLFRTHEFKLEPFRTGSESHHYKIGVESESQSKKYLKRFSSFMAASSKALLLPWDKALAREEPPFAWAVPPMLVAV